MFIRPIEPGDDAGLATVIRSVMPEFGASGPGFAIHDVEVDAMCAAYRRPRCAYFVIAEGARVWGGGGVAPLDGGDAQTCELKKMYVLPDARGKGFGRELIARCLHAARAHGFRRCYLETLVGMTTAMRLYEAYGFRRIPAALGATGHFGCNRFYLLDL